MKPNFTNVIVENETLWIFNRAVYLGLSRAILQACKKALRKGFGENTRVGWLLNAN